MLLGLHSPILETPVERQDCVCARVCCTCVRAWGRDTWLPASLLPGKVLNRDLRASGTAAVAPRRTLSFEGSGEPQKTWMGEKRAGGELLRCLATPSPAAPCPHPCVTTEVLSPRCRRGAAEQRGLRLMNFLIPSDGDYLARSGDRPLSGMGRNCCREEGTEPQPQRSQLQALHCDGAQEKVPGSFWGKQDPLPGSGSTWIC